MPREIEYLPTPEEIAATCTAIRGNPEWTPERGSSAILALSLVDRMVAQVLTFCERWRTRKETWRPDRYFASRETARDAVEWLLSDERSDQRLAFADICDHCGLDIEETRAKIMARFPLDGLRELALSP